MAAEALGAPPRMWQPAPLAASLPLIPEDEDEDEGIMISPQTNSVMVAPLPEGIMIGPPLPA